MQTPCLVGALEEKREQGSFLFCDSLLEFIVDVRSSSQRMLSTKWGFRFHSFYPFLSVKVSLWLTHSHTLTHSHSTHSRTYALTHTHAPMHSHTHPRTHALTHSCTHALMHSHTLTHTQTHSQTLRHTHKNSHTLTHMHLTPSPTPSPRQITKFDAFENCQEIPDHLASPWQSGRLVKTS